MQLVLHPATVTIGVYGWLRPARIAHPIIFQLSVGMQFYCMHRRCVSAIAECRYRIATAVRDFSARVQRQIASRPRGLKLFAVLFFFKRDGWCFSQLWPLSLSFSLSVLASNNNITRSTHTHIYMYTQYIK